MGQAGSPPLPRGGRRDPAPWVPALGWGISAREKPEVWWTQESSDGCSHPVQAAKLPKNLNSVPVEGCTWVMGDLTSTGLLRETRQDSQALWDKQLCLVLRHFSSPCVFRTFVSSRLSAWHSLQTRSALSCQRMLFR